MLYGTKYNTKYRCAMKYPGAAAVFGRPGTKNPAIAGFVGGRGGYDREMADLWNFLIGVSPILLVMLATIIAGGVVLIKRRRH